ncbi:hypothetical protein BC628DRAFT_1368527 [Trametes gibbosa]|nr:hypothetical protein BC628DRAFT_1368527 [Trametes gibbosa]
MAFPTPLALIVYLTPALAYIPAQAANAAQNTGVNVSDTFRLTLKWYPDASFAETVSYQLAGHNTTGVSRGAFVHFSEDQLPKNTTTTPWIALISCDGNATQASATQDIFTLAKERGAVAAVLYSLTSPACQINPQYTSQARMGPALDVYATQSLSSSALIENEFLNLDNSGVYYSFNPATLNASSSMITNAIANGTVSGPGFMLATLNSSPNASDASPSSASGGSQATDQPSPKDSIIPPNLPKEIIAFIAIVGAILIGMCAFGIRKWYRRGWRRPFGHKTGGGHAAGSGENAADQVTDVESRETRVLASGTLAGAGGDSVATHAGPASSSSSGSRADSNVVERQRSSRRVGFSSDRLVRPLGDQPEFEMLDTIEEVRS